MKLWEILLVLLLFTGCTGSDESQDDLELKPIEDFDFDVDVDPAIVTIEQGGTAEVDVTVKLVRGESQQVKLTITNWGAGITTQFANPTPSADTSTKLYITASCDTKADDYLHTVQGEVGTRTSVDSVNVKVEEKSDCTEPTTAKSTPTGPEEPVTISVKADCTIDKTYPPDEYGTLYGDLTTTHSGSASGPVNSYLGTLINRKENYPEDRIIDCGAWGNNCKRDEGEPSVTSWSEKKKWVHIATGLRSTNAYYICGTNCGNKALTQKVTASCTLN